MFFYFIQSSQLTSVTGVVMGGVVLVFVVFLKTYNIDNDERFRKGSNDATLIRIDHSGVILSKICHKNHNVK